MNSHIRNVGDLIGELQRFSPTARMIPENLEIWGPSPATSCTLTGCRSEELDSANDEKTTAEESYDDLLDDIKELQRDMDGLTHEELKEKVKELSL